MTDTTELRRLAEAATPGPWGVFHPERDCFDPATGHYTVPIGPHVVMKSGDAPWETAAIDGQNGEANAAYIAAMHPKTTLALLDELAELRSSAITFLAPWAVAYSKMMGLPPGHLYTAHYDLLEKCGARMVDFVRHDNEQ